MTIPNATLHRWATAGNKSQKVAAWLAAWAATQPPGTIVPADDVIISELPEGTAQNGAPSANSPACTRRVSAQVTSNPRCLDVATCLDSRPADPETPERRRSNTPAGDALVASDRMPSARPEPGRVSRPR